MSKTKFSIGVAIEAIDKVTAPVRGITAALKKMTAAGEQSAKASGRGGKGGKGGKEESDNGKKEKEKAKREGGLFGRIGSMVPQIAAAVGGIAALTEGYNRVTAASDEALAASQKLTLTMLKMKGTTQGDVDAIMDLSGELQKTTAYGDELYMGMASQLAVFKMAPSQIKAMLPALSDYLALTKGINATEEDGEAAAKLMGKAWSGNVGALKKQGIVLTKAQEAIIKHGTQAQKTAVLIRAIESRAGGLAKQQASGTPEGMKKVWENQLGEIEEKAGLALKPLREGAIKAAYLTLPYLEKIADGIPKFFDRAGSVARAGWAQVTGLVGKGFAGADTGKFIKSFVSWGPILKRIFLPILPVLRSITTWLFKAIGQIGKWLVELWNKSQPGLKALVEAFKPIIDIIKNLWERVLKPFWDSLLAPLLGWLLGTFVPFILNILGPAIKWLATAISKALDWLIGLFEGIFKWFKQVAPMVGEFFTKFWGRMKVGWSVFKVAITSAWHGLFNGLFNWIEDKWKGFMDLLRKVGNWLGFGGGPSASGPSRSVESAGPAMPPAMRGRLKTFEPISPNMRPADAFGPGLKLEPTKASITIIDKTSGGVKVQKKSGSDLRGLALGQAGALSL